MSLILFRLNGVPDDEARDIRELLAENHIAYYETPPGKWGISVAAIWLKDGSRLGAAKALIEEYQRNRMLKARQEYDTLKREGKAETVFDSIKRNPIRFLFFAAMILFILYVSTKPFMDFGK
ncbi:MAG: DUF6164 family protein [Pseudomonadota bacterium]